MYGQLKKARYHVKKTLLNGKSINAHISPKGYYGVFWGSVSNEDGSVPTRMKKFGDGEIETENAQEYFYDMKVDDRGNDAYDIINDNLHRHLQTHIGEVDPIKYHWQCGFGGDEMDGMLDFWLPTKIKCPPDMKFAILGKNYVMSFSYAEDDSGLSSEEEDQDDDD